MAAKAEIEKLQDRLLFVSMKDYNIVVAENKFLRQVLKERGIEITEQKEVIDTKEIKENPYISRQKASVELGLSGKKIIKYAELGAIKTKRTGQYTYYFKPDLIKHAELLKVRGTIKRVSL